MKENNEVINLAEYIHQKEMIKTITPSNLLHAVSHPESNLSKRIVAFGIDLAVIMLIRSGIHMAYALFINEAMSPLSIESRQSLAFGSVLLHLSIFVCIYTTYFFYTSFVLDGKTVGKMTMGLRVIDENFVINREQVDYQLSLRNAFKRALGYLACFFSFGVFFIFNFSSEDNRGLPDYLSNSRTVSDQWLVKAIETKTFDHEHIFIDVQDLNRAA